MSSGEIIRDDRYWTATSCGTTRLGSFYMKTWSGGNGSSADEHPYSCDVINFTDPGLTWSFSADAPGVVRSGGAESCGFAPTILAHHTYDDNATLKAISRLGNKLRRHEFNAAVNIGEARESVRMIGDTARSLALAFVSLKRGKAGDALQALGLKPKASSVLEVQRHLRDGLASAWLGMQYGWLPLLGAVDDAAKALASNLAPRRTTFRTMINGKGGKIGGAGGNFSAGGTYKRSRSLIWRVEEEDQFTTLEEFGFTSLELVAWELTTLSFVADWFIPIGDFLEARSVLSSVRGKYIDTDFERWSLQMGSSPSYIIHSGRCSYSGCSIRRTIGGISEMPLPRPSLKNPFSTSHALSGIALLQTAFGRR